VHIAHDNVCVVDDDEVGQRRDLGGVASQSKRVTKKGRLLFQHGTGEKKKKAHILAEKRHERSVAIERKLLLLLRGASVDEVDQLVRFVSRATAGLQHCVSRKQVHALLCNEVEVLARKE
jgi:hypothetical protein